MLDYLIVGIISILETAICILFFYKKEKLFFVKRTDDGACADVVETECPAGSEEETVKDDDTETAEIDEDNAVKTDTSESPQAEEKAPETEEKAPEKEEGEAADVAEDQSAATEKEEASKSDCSENAEEEKGKGSKIVKPYSKNQSIILSVLCFAVFAAASLFIIKNTENYFGFAKLSFVLLAVVISAIVDFKKTIIPNEIIFTGFAVRAVLYVLELIFFPDDILLIAKSDLFGLALGFGVLLLAYIISRKGIGFGDVKLFALIGIFVGPICTYTTLLGALIFNTIISVILIVSKKKKKEDGIPFAPSILVGYLVSVLISSF